MPRQITPRAQVARVVALGLLASIACAVALAPIMSVGWCSDGPAGGQSLCHSESRSLLGGYAPWWLWAAAQIAIVTVTVVVARRRALAPR